jgi:long-chain fatty acid transport protein
MKQHALALTLTTILATMALQQAQAAAFNLNEHSASGLGRAFAGEAAIADNASVLSRNPAAMTRFKSMELSVAGTYVRPNIDLKGREDVSIPTSQGTMTLPKSYLDADDIAPSAFIPSTYFIQPLNDQWSWGLALFSNYGLSTQFDNNYAAGVIGGKTKLTTFNINPNVAYRINDHWSAGVGVSAIYADATLIRRAGALAMLNPQLQADTELVNLSGTTWDWGWNAGTLFEFNENNRWGLSYRSGTTLNFDGDFKGATSNFQQVPGSLDLELPALAEFSGYHQLAPNYAIHYSVQWTGWDVFKELKATGSGCTNTPNSGVCFQKDQDFNDSWRYAIGASYFLDPQWTLRAGLALDKQAAHNVISIPDTERMWYSLGLTYAPSTQWSMDLGVAYLDGKDVNINESLSPGLNASYTSTASAVLAAAQLNYRF